MKCNSRRLLVQTRGWQEENVSANAGFARERKQAIAKSSVLREGGGSKVNSKNNSTPNFYTEIREGATVKLTKELNIKYYSIFCSVRDRSNHKFERFII